MLGHFGGVDPVQNKKKETINNSLRALNAGAVITLGTFGCNNRKIMATAWTDWNPIREPLGTSDIKEGAAGAVGE
jgi:hypothetical protein